MDLSAHDEFVRIFKESGMDALAAKLGVLSNGEIPDLKAAELSADERQKRKRIAQDIAKSVGGALSSENLSKLSASEAGAAAGLLSVPAPVPLDSQQMRRKQRRHLVAAGADSQFDQDGMQRGAAQRAERYPATEILRRLRELRGSRVSYRTLASDIIAEVQAASAQPASLLAEEAAVLRRRVYDVLNVLIALGLVEKNAAGRIFWKERPPNPERDLALLEKERSDLYRRVQTKHAQLQEMLRQEVALQGLAERNRADPDAVAENERVHLPFVVVSTDKDALVECEMTEDQTDVILNMSRPFEIHDDTEVLRRLGLHDASEEALRRYLPEDALKFLSARSSGGDSDERAADKAPRASGQRSEGTTSTE